VVGACGVHVSGGRPEIQTNVIQKCPHGPGVLCTGGTPLIESNVVEECAVGIHIRTSRPMVRLNEVTSSRVSGVLVETAQLPLLGVYRTGPDDSRLSAYLDEASDITLVNPMHEADPHVEANVMTDNQRNICVYSCTGTFLKNELTISADDNIVLDGPQSVAVVVSGNVIGGSVKGACVLLSNKVEARIQGNEMRGAQQAAVVMRGCGFSEVQRNTGEDCQGGVTAMGGAVGRIAGNIFGAGMEIAVFTDSQATVAVL
jgi:nitrous oxidase accessory protein NosD